MNTVDTPVREAVGFLSGSLNGAAVSRVFKSVGIAIESHVRQIHIFMMCTGGPIGDAICLYNFFRVFPIALSVYAVGNLGPEATIAYLGAKRRIVTEHARFWLGATRRPRRGSANALHVESSQLSLDDARVRRILEERTDVKINAPFGRFRLSLSANEAVHTGLAHTVDGFRPSGPLVYVNLAPERVLDV